MRFFDRVHVHSCRLLIFKSKHLNLTLLPATVCDPVSCIAVAVALLGFLLLGFASLFTFATLAALAFSSYAASSLRFLRLCIASTSVGKVVLAAPVALLSHSL